MRVAEDEDVAHTTTAALLSAFGPRARDLLREAIHIDILDFWGEFGGYFWGDSWAIF